MADIFRDILLSLCIRCPSWLPSWTVMELRWLRLHTAAPDRAHLHVAEAEG